MELVNVLLESESEKIKLKYEIDPNKCRRTGCEMNHAIDYFLSVLKKFIKLEESVFYLVIKDVTLFTFKYDRDTISVIENNFYTYNKELVADHKNTSDITAICFTITDDMSISIRPKPGYSIKVRSDNSRYY